MNRAIGTASELLMSGAEKEKVELCMAGAWHWVIS